MILGTVPSYMLCVSKLYERRFMLPTFLSIGIYGERRGKELWLYQRLMVGVRGGRNVVRVVFGVRNTHIYLHKLPRVIIQYFLE